MNHTEDFGPEAWHDFGKANEVPFMFRNLTYIHSVEESKQLNSLPGPFMVISASGMCEGGRVLHHLKNNIEDRNAIILLTGYQAQNTLGPSQDGGEWRTR
jgi:metallo-beta-lactamase family protein